MERMSEEKALNERLLLNINYDYYLGLETQWRRAMRDTEKKPFRQRIEHILSSTSIDFCQQ